MKKIITIVSVLIISISISACSSKTSNIIKSEETPVLSTINVIDDEKTAENYVKSKGYEITARKGEVQKYTLEKSQLYGATETIPYQQAWGVQTVEPDKYFGKEIIICQFIVKNHPLQERDKNAKDGVNVSIMLSEGKIIGGTSYPNAIVRGSCSSIDGKTLEEVTGLSYQQWSDKWKKKYAN